MDPGPTHTGLTHAGDAAVIPAPQQGATVRKAPGWLLLAMAHIPAPRLVLPQRGLSAEWFRFPPP